MDNQEHNTNSKQQPSSSNTPPTAQKQTSRMRPVVIGAASAVAGLIVGGAGIYGLIKLTEKPQECPECNCSEDIAGPINGTDYSFLKLEKTGQNIVYSPLSINNGLSLLSAGAEGRTKDEIDSVLFSAVIPKYQNIPDKLSLANAVFIRDTFKDSVLSAYTDEVQNNLNGEVLYDSFESTDNMDNWVKQKTFNLIDQIGVQVNPELKMVLSNALAIQMDWKNKFDPEETSSDFFYGLTDETEMEATTMHQKTSSPDTKYYYDDEVTALSMPLDTTSENVNLDFIAIMPSKSLVEYTKSFDEGDVDNIVNNFKPANETEGGVLISIPKFKIDYSLNFKEDLEKLGIKSAFTSEADFSKMSTSPLSVGAALHKSNIDFSEDGVKAAAITVFSMKVISGQTKYDPQPIEITIDHPFLFLIRDASDGTIWFTGAVYQPNLWADDAEQYSPSN